MLFSQYRESIKGAPLLPFYWNKYSLWQQEGLADWAWERYWQAPLAGCRVPAFPVVHSVVCRLHNPALPTFCPTPIPLCQALGVQPKYFLCSSYT